MAAALVMAQFLPQGGGVFAVETENSERPRKRK
jgi:hypothetical protein